MKILNTLITIILLTQCVISQTVDLELGLQAYYPFSGNANDESGNGHDGTTFGGVTLTADRFGVPGCAYEFDGFNDYINTFSTFNYDHRTVSFWIYPYDLQGSGAYARVALTQDDDALEYGKIRVDITNGVMNLYAGGKYGKYSTSSVSIKNWYHLVLIRDGDLVKYYVDGDLVLVGDSDPIGSTIHPNDDFVIGAGRYTTTQHFKGKIDDIRIYDRAVNECEVTALYLGNAINLDHGLQAFYPFSGNANDESGNGHDGTTFGDVSLTNDRFGNPESAYEFDGVNDYINTSSTFDYSHRSVSFWFKPYDLYGSGNNAHVILTQDDDVLDYGKIRADLTDGEMNLYAGGKYGHFNTSAISTASWYHIVLIRKGPYTEYYMDDSLVHTADSDAIGSYINPNSDFIIGSGRTTTNQFFSGIIDDIRIYDRALNSCEIDSLFNFLPTSIGDNSAAYENIEVYPNPCKNRLNLVMKNNKKILSVCIINQYGRQVLFQNNKVNPMIINLSSLSAGVYVIHISLPSGLIHRKIIKL